MRKKVLTLQELERSSERIRERDGRLVLTNGCFDILHVGHIRYLQAARELGTALAVAINSDASVRRLKGPGRPLMTDVERAEIVAALQSVDYVTIFDADTAECVVQRVRPAVYVKGGDYSEDADAAGYPPEARVAVSQGGTFKTLPYVAHRSTSGFMQALRGSTNGDC